jgi:hypothetical protein
LQRSVHRSPGMPRNPIDREPNLIGADLGEIADRILAAEGVVRKR